MTEFSFSDHIDIANKRIGGEGSVFIVAEAGVAHFGSLQKAFRLVDVAANAGADAVKFQIFKTDDLVSASSGDWYKRLKSRELSRECFREIRDYCRMVGIPFFATAHDAKSLKCLDELEIPFYKIGSGEVTNWPYIEEIAQRGKPVLLSTGMYTLKEIGRALKIFERANNPDVVVLHCVTSYPTVPEEVNLKAMDTIREQFGIITGYSDHTEGLHVPLAAVARGASVLEKHISLDFDVPDAQDWKVSCSPEDLKLLIMQSREVVNALGTGIKSPSKSELRAMSWARKSIVAARYIPAGTIISHNDLTVKRPGTGIPPSDQESLQGRVVARDITEGTVIKWEMLK